MGHALGLLRGPLAEAYLLACRYPRHQQNCGKLDNALFEDLKISIADTDWGQIRRLSGICVRF